MFNSHDQKAKGGDNGYHFSKNSEHINVPDFFELLVVRDVLTLSPMLRITSELRGCCFVEAEDTFFLFL